MLKKAYLEITNECNLSCSFCHGTVRQVRYMSRDEFVRAAEELRHFTSYLYFHLMGEPLLHPLLADFLCIACDMGFKVILTTNGTLLKQKKDILLSSPSLHKISISLHCFEANVMDISLKEYLGQCFSFCDEATQKGKIGVMRLWNVGGEDSFNKQILSCMHDYFNGEWQKLSQGYKIREKLFLEWGERFDWPDTEADNYSESHSCYGLRDQVGILSDGSVVPCCLDSDGTIALGNIFSESLSDILSSPRATAIKSSFETRRITEPLCLHCGFAIQKFGGDK